MVVSHLLLDVFTFSSLMVRQWMLKDSARSEAGACQTHSEFSFLYGDFGKTVDDIIALSLLTGPNPKLIKLINFPNLQTR